jgi:hypothetical protein
LLDVNGGDININSTANGYRLTTGVGSNYVLRQNNIPSNIYVGTLSGNGNATNSNTFVGYKSGFKSGNTGVGVRNTFVGNVAGFNNDQGEENSYFGDSCGYHTVGVTTGTTSGRHNTFLGASAGFWNVDGRSNVYTGFEAGYNNTGDYNVMIGRACGRNAFGSDNCYYGKDVAQSINGSDNCYYGSHAGDDSQNPSGYITGNSVFGTTAGRNFIGNNNCFFGIGSGQGIFGAGASPFTGNFNSFFGAGTIYGTSNTNLNYTGAFGYNARPTSDNKIIIGANQANSSPICVGIGLSDDQYTLAYGPRSALEINGDPSTTDPTTGNGASGLQFRQLHQGVATSNTNAWQPEWGGVLTVDGTGIVKLTKSFGFGICNDPTILSTGLEMITADQNIYYNGNGWSPGHDYVANNAIGIGYGCQDVLPAKLSVNQNNPYALNVDVSTVAGFFHNGDYSSCPPNDLLKYGLLVACDGVNDGSCGPNVYNIAGRFDAANSSKFNTGIVGTAFSGSWQNIGGDFEAEEGGVINRAVNGSSVWNNSGNNVGGHFEGSNSSSSNYGVIGTTAGGGSGYNIGVFGYSPMTSNCSNSFCFDAAGYFNGDVYIVGGANYYASDSRLKNNIQPLESSLNIINSLKPKTFDFIQSQNKNLQLPITSNQCGLIAQDLQGVLPELVHEFKVPLLPDTLGNVDSTGLLPSYLGVNYLGLIPYLIGGIKEQQSTIDSLKQADSLLLNRLNQLEQMINNCCNSQTGSLRIGQKVDLTDVTTIVLNQNIPNPFSEETFINFTVPSTIKNALIIIYDKTGNVLKTVPISERGESSIHIYAANLSSGTYTYSLICDGQLIDTKQMVCQK